MGCCCNNAVARPPEVRRGTSPSVELRVSADLTDFDKVEVLVKGSHLHTFEGEDVEIVGFDNSATVLRIKLTQEMTLDMARCAYFQVRALDADGAAYATNIVQAIATGILGQEVLS